MKNEQRCAASLYTCVQNTGVNGISKSDPFPIIIGMLEEYLLFTGRPNAGKSSIIREIVGLDVVTGKRPGTTRSISKHPLNSGLVLVDMPGYGRMMGVSRRLENMRKNRIISFLESNAQDIALAIHVLDISTFLEVSWRLEKKGIISIDVEMIQFLAKKLREFPLVAANKIDKTSKKERNSNLEEFMHRISNGHISDVVDRVFAVSAKTGEGLSALRSEIREKLVAKGYRTPFKVR
ncbi:MAG: 50S ribosome-binding GTPase [Candidatus Bathyarchaeota archaeon]|nr:50S ribosome-binding GTPase [Candidatus Bathyarchaeota archaeon]